MMPRAFSGGENIVLFTIEFDHQLVVKAFVRDNLMFQ